MTTLVLVVFVFVVSLSNVEGLVCTPDEDGIRKLLLQNCSELVATDLCKIELRLLTNAFKNGTYGWHICPTECKSCNSQYQQWKGSQSTKPPNSEMNPWINVLIIGVCTSILLIAFVVLYRSVRKGKKDPKGHRTPKSDMGDLSQISTFQPPPPPAFETSSASSADFGGGGGVNPTSPDDASHPLSMRLLGAWSATGTPSGTVPPFALTPSGRGSAIRPRSGTISQRRSALPPSGSRKHANTMMSSTVGALRELPALPFQTRRRTHSEKPFG